MVTVRGERDPRLLVGAEHRWRNDGKDAPGRVGTGRRETGRAYAGSRRDWFAYCFAGSTTSASSWRSTLRSWCCTVCTAVLPRCPGRAVLPAGSVRAGLPVGCPGGQEDRQ
ncbi:hypothetical protein GCM10009706_20240 [Curtobacterium citreum]|nr:hypothetical protein GCM10009706_20240 [Curtobacterium citreum]